MQWPASGQLRMLRVARTDAESVNDDADNIVAELKRELVVFYDQRGETLKARGVTQLLNEHPAEHIAVSLSQKYGIAALPPSWAMVAQIAGSPSATPKLAMHHALPVLLVLLALYALTLIPGK